MSDLEKRIDEVLTSTKAAELRPPHGRRRSPRKKPMKPQSVKRRWREYDANVREAARQGAAYARQQEAEAVRLSQDPSRCWRCGEKESDCRCAAIGNYAGYGGKRRHGGGRIHSYIEGYMSAPPSRQYEHLRGAIVRHAGKSWSVDQVSGDEAYLRPLGNMYGEGCKTVACRELKKAGGGKRRSAAGSATAKYYTCPECEANFRDLDLVDNGKLPPHTFCGTRCPGSGETVLRSACGKRRSAPVYGPRGGVTEVQSYLFPRSLWTEARAKAWAKRNGKLYGDVDVTDKYIRLRQASPDSFKRMRTKVLMKRGQKAVIKSVIGIRR